MGSTRLAICPEGYFDITSPCSFAFLRSIVPLSLLVVFALSCIPIPNSIRRRFSPYSIIFHDQASLASLAPSDIIIKRKGPEVWRQSLFVGLAAVQAVLWTGQMGAEIATFVNRPWKSSAFSSWSIWSSAVTAMIWIFLTFQPLFYPSCKPRISTTILYFTELIFSSMSLAAFAFETYVTRSIPSWVTPQVFAMDVVGVVLGVTLIGLVMGLRLVEEEVVRSVNAELEDNTTLFEWLTFTWVDPLIKLGSSKDLTDAEVPNLSPTQTTATAFNLLQAMTGSKLLHRLVKANAFDLFMDAVGTVIASFCAFLSPYFIKQILEGITTPTREKVATAYIYACLAFGVSIFKALVDLQHLWYGRRASIRIKNQMIAAVYDKALRRKDASGVIAEKENKDNKDGKETKVEVKKSSDSGRVVNLMASDANNVANTISGMYWVYGAPVQIVFALGFLYSMLGWSALVGISTMIFMAPLNRYFASRSQALSAARSKATDRRIQVMNEIISAIRVIKFFAWTDKYRGKAAEARKTELDWSIKQMWNSMGYILVWTTGPLLVSTISFALFILVQKGDLTVSVAFTSVSLFAQLRQPLTIVPTFYQMILRALVSLQRMEDFLDEDEVEDWVSSLKALHVSPEEAANTKIGFEQASFRWNTGVNVKAEQENKSTEQHDDGNGTTTPPFVFELSDLDVIFPTGKLSVISGPTGAGKSAVLAALLGEMDCISGRSYLPKYPQVVDSETGLKNSVAYASQTPWLQNMSIKLNILFGERYDEDRYIATVKACALEADFDALDDGDDTEIGSKGLALSGGQKARVALARAVYSHTQHVLLDDVLAAVDSHTGRHLYERCLKGPLLKGRTVILVTHHLELLLPGTDYLVQINDGRVEQHGTPAALREKGVLNQLVALEEASLEKHEAILTKDEVDKEVVAVDGETTDNGNGKLAKKNKVARKLVQDEDRATGHVEWAAYKLYLEASSWIVWIICVILLVLQQGSNVGERLWLSIWSSAYVDSFKPLLFTALSATRHAVPHDAHHDGVAYHVAQQAYIAAGWTNATITSKATTQIVAQWPSAQAHPGYYLGIYTAITIGGVILGLLQSINSFLGGLKACRTIHDGMLQNVMGSTIRFFDTTPAGRIINRFSRDIETIDGSLTSSLRTVLQQVATLIGSLALVASIVPAFLLPAAFISYGYYRLSVVYLSCTRDLRRIEATKRSPIFGGFAELLDGITVVRAYGVEGQFRSTLFKQVDGAQGAFYHMWMANRWLLVRMDSLGAASVFFTSILALAGAVPAGLAGVAILSAQTFVEGCYWISRFWGGLEQDFNSVERAKTYLELPQEPPSTIEGHRPPAYWPSSTTTNSFLSCEKVSIKYAPDLPNVINKVSFEIKAREKIGLLGRTGSGKSTMAMALLRFVDPAEGRILIDGIDITSIGVDDLRSRVTYIPQDAVLFSGTIRENLDPFNEYNDEEMLEALQAVHLRTTDTPAPSRVPSGMRLSALAEEEDRGASKAASTVVSTMQSKVTLDTEVASGGSNFSQGQRQLLAMARALLRKSNLVIADEATASIDFATDEAIQSTIRTGFKDACVLTIAHRISSVIDYDRLLILAGGEIAEFDTPINLLRKDDSVFKSLCEQSGRYQELFKAAEAAEKAKASMSG